MSSLCLTAIKETLLVSFLPAFFASENIVLLLTETLILLPNVEVLLSNLQQGEEHI